MLQPPLLSMTPKRLSAVVLVLAIISLFIGSYGHGPAEAAADQIRFRLNADSPLGSLLIVGGTKARCSFTLKNGTSDPIVITGLTSSCTCISFLTPPPAHQIVEGGEELQLNAMIETSPSRYDVEIVVQIQFQFQRMSLLRVCRFLLDCVPPVEVVPAALALDDIDRPISETTRLKVWVAESAVASDTPLCQCDLSAVRVMYVRLSNPRYDPIRRMTHIADLVVQINPNCSSETGFITLTCQPFGAIDIPVCVVKRSITTKRQRP